MKEFKNNLFIDQFLTKLKILDIEERQDPFDYFVVTAKSDFKSISCWIKKNCCCCMPKCSFGTFGDITRFLRPGLKGIKQVFGFLPAVFTWVKEIKNLGWYPCRGVKSCVP